MPAEKPEDEVIISGAVDRTVRVWRRDGDSFALIATFDSIYKGSINAIATSADFPGIFAAASSDGTVALFSVAAESDTVTHLHSFSTAPSFYPLCIAISKLPTSDALILAVAGSSKSISIYVGPSAESPLTHAATLTGHENWLRSLCFTTEPGSGDLILASASQDRYIRLWRVHLGEELPAATASSESKMIGLTTRLSNKAHMLKVGSSLWSTTFEALLMGHEDWIYTALWHPTEHVLLSSSADNSLSIWAPDPESGIWLTTTRLGEISDLKGASTATGAAGGLWNGLWSPDGRALAALTKTGSWRVWQYDADVDRWSPKHGISGHLKEVAALSWSPGGEYLLSTGRDQTTRLWAPWNDGGGWHELSRPQIHGYDLNSIATVSATRFVSGADEKLLRVFDQPKGVATLLEALAGVKKPGADEEEMPTEAGLPVLGLSNKLLDTSPAAPTDGEEAAEGDFTAESAAAAAAADATPTAPPTEDRLARHTLWPEHEKLYGHGYEISSLAASRCAPIIATACKASSINHAVIRIYSTETWREIKPPLRAHDLTTTAMAFEPPGGHCRLLSVGRDRAWAVLSPVQGTTSQWTTEKHEKAHTRVIYDCAWLAAREDEPEPRSGAFVTASRDKTLKLWSERLSVVDGRTASDQWTCVSTAKSTVPLTAVDVLRDTRPTNKHWILCGAEDGTLTLYSCYANVLELVTVLDTRYASPSPRHPYMVRWNGRLIHSVAVSRRSDLSLAYSGGQ